jgi:hypothetical protein
MPAASLFFDTSPRQFLQFRAGLSVTSAIAPLFVLP